MAKQDLNHCTFIGRLGQDPEQRTTTSGLTVTSFSIACNWRTKNAEGAEWVRCNAWDKLGDICAQYLHKGSQVFISGPMRTRKWTDGQGIERYSTEIAVRDMQMLDSAPQQAPARQQEPQQAPQQAPARQPAPQQGRPSGYRQQAQPQPQDANAAEYFDDDIPF